ncbi:MAG: hypothetical protein RI892_707, partial [Pseudomonadota bacterium]
VFTAKNVVLEEVVLVFGRATF